MAELPFEAATPVRRFPAYPGKRAHEGSYWFANSATHVRFESHFESVALMLLDFSQQVHAVSSNPFWLLWPRGSTPARHAPDFFARRKDGTVHVIDVHPAEHMSATIRSQHLLTRQMCSELGWRYTEFTRLAPAVQHNVALISAYRHPRFTPAEQLQTEICTMVDSAPAIKFGDLLATVCERTGIQRGCVLSGMYHLIWARKLTVDLQTPLSNVASVR